METYWLWLCSQKGIYQPQIKKLMDTFENPKEVFDASEKKIKSCAYLNEQQKAKLLSSRNDWEADKKKHEMAEKGIRFISLAHEEYPDNLKNITDPPYGLFVKGILPKQKTLSVGIVGARRCTYYGKQSAEQISTELAGAGVQIISGMALGIDGYSQMAALKGGGKSFAVLGCGVDICYPQTHSNLYRQLCEHGGVISEYPPGSEPLAWHFPLRNRIISGLSDYLLIIEAREKSGSLITADYALEQGRDVLAVPGRMDDVLSGGCNRFIAQGAGIILSLQDLRRTLGLDDDVRVKIRKNNILLETEEELLYSCLDLHLKSLHEILCDVDMPVQKVLSLLTALELKGYIEEPMKNYYAKIN